MTIFYVGPAKHLFPGPFAKRCSRAASPEGDCPPDRNNPFYHFNSPSPPISLVISSIRSRGKGGEDTGFIARDISFMGLSSAAMRFELSAPQILQR